ncbi:MAG: polysaccharide deacetylase family protein [Actinomycetota bacterium]|nr:polysaccharide deacetylase family protein [Actinomycetota bacterium]
MRPLLVSLAVALALVALPTRSLADAFSVQLTSPPAGATVFGTEEVDATTQGTVTSVSFDWSSDGGATWQPIGTDSVADDDQWSATWDTGSFSGPAELRAIASDGSTTSAPSTESVTVDNTTVFVTLSSAPPVFSPNGDGHLDVAKVTVMVSKPVILDVSVTTLDGTLVKALVSGRQVQAGAAHLTWRGRHLVDGHWRPVADGPYTVAALATDDVGTQGTARTTVDVDTTPPTFAWGGISPEPLRRDGRLRYSFRAADLDAPLKVTLSVWDLTGRVAEKTGYNLKSGPWKLSWRPAYSDGSALIPGLYQGQVTITDQAHNTTVSPFEPFRVLRPVTTTVFHDLTGVGNRVALTFDDCNFGDAWTSILNTLDSFRVKGTFFCIGANVERYPSQARRTVADGMTIGSHTRDHPDLTRLPYAAVRAEVLFDQNTWWKVAHATPAPYFRPPYGSFDPTVLRAAGSAGYLRTMIWDVDPQDWADPGVPVIADRVLSHAHAGMIVVMHVKPQTAAALPSILRGLASRGLRQVSLTEMFQAAGYHA